MFTMEDELLGRRQLQIASSDRALADDLQARILNGEITPGEPLREQMLSDEYGVGRYTVRAALQRLAHDGFVKLEPHRGATVSRFTADDIREIYWIRGMMEEGVAVAMAERGIRPVAAERELAKFESLPDDAPWRTVVDMDMALHQALVSSLGSSRLDSVFRSLSREMRFCLMQLRPFYPTPSVLAHEHRKLIDAIASGNRDRAASVVRQHLDQAAEVIANDHPKEGR
jgi:DNA-binding GntR family transcriptional regulator